MEISENKSEIYDLIRDREKFLRNQHEVSDCRKKLEKFGFEKVRGERKYKMVKNNIGIEKLDIVFYNSYVDIDFIKRTKNGGVNEEEGIRLYYYEYPVFNENRTTTSLFEKIKSVVIEMFEECFFIENGERIKDE